MTKINSDIKQCSNIRSFGALFFFSVWLIVCVFGCAAMNRVPSPQLNGTFSGTSNDGRRFSLTLQQKEHTVIGAGLWDDQEFGLSALTAPQGPMVISTAEGSPIPGHIALSPNGQTVTLIGLGDPIQLVRGGPPVDVLPGPFSGRFVIYKPLQIHLDLTQGGDLIAGTGYLDGKAVAVVGKVVAADRARGAVLYSDESRHRVSVSLSTDRRTLTIEGLGAPIVMKRK